MRGWSEIKLQSNCVQVGKQALLGILFTLSIPSIFLLLGFALVRNSWASNVLTLKVESVESGAGQNGAARPSHVDRQDFFSWLRDHDAAPKSSTSFERLERFLERCLGASSARERGKIAQDFLSAEARFLGNSHSALWCLMRTSLSPQDAREGFVSQLSLDQKKELLILAHKQLVGESGHEYLGSEMTVTLMRFLGQIWASDRSDRTHSTDRTHSEDPPYSAGSRHLTRPADLTDPNDLADLTDLRNQAFHTINLVVTLENEPAFHKLVDIQTFGFVKRLADRVIAMSEAFEDVNGSAVLRVLTAWLDQSMESRNLQVLRDREYVQKVFLKLAQKKLESKSLISSSSVALNRFVFQLLALAFQRSGDYRVENLVRSVIESAMDTQIITMGLIALRSVSKNPFSREFETYQLWQMSRISNWQDANRVRALLMPLLANPDIATEGVGQRLASTVLAVVRGSDWRAKAQIFSDFEDLAISHSPRLVLFLGVILHELQVKQSSLYLTGDEHLTDGKEHDDEAPAALKEILHLAVEFIPRLKFQDAQILAGFRRIIIDQRHIRFLPYPKFLAVNEHSKRQNQYWEDLVKAFLEYEKGLSRKELQGSDSCAQIFYPTKFLNQSDPRVMGADR